MKTVKLLRADIYFQYRYGFYLLYLFFTLMYSVILNFLPDSWQKVVGAVIILSDPALIGLIFMGAIVLFEKSERVLNSISVSPINLHHYIISKALSITIISLLSGVVIALAGSEITYLPTFILGIFLGSILFSLIGLIVSARSSTLNGFLMKVMPIMTLAMMPAVTYLMGYDHWAFQIIPSIACINLILCIESFGVISVFVLVLWIAVIYCYTFVSIKKMMKKLGGVNL